MVFKYFFLTQKYPFRLLSDVNSAQKRLLKYFSVAMEQPSFGSGVIRSSPSRVPSVQDEEHKSDEEKVRGSQGFAHQICALHVLNTELF